jgi:dihydrolipoamide dehydrogenase
VTLEQTGPHAENPENPGNPANLDQVFDRVLVSVGRRPNSKIPGLERTAVQVNERGFIVVDNQCRTAEPSIFAIGDVVGEPMLAHKASHEGRVAVEVIAGDNVVFAPRAIPAVVFTDPELAWAGLTEAQAAKEQRQVSVAKFPWAPRPRHHARPHRRPHEADSDPKTQRVLGVGLVGPGAGELIAEGVLAIEMDATPQTSSCPSIRIRRSPKP